MPSRPSLIVQFGLLSAAWFAAVGIAVSTLVVPTAAADSAEAAIRSLWAVLGVGLMFSLLVQRVMVAGASRRLREEAERNEYLANHDPLTGLGNRACLRDALGALLDAREPFAVFLFDLDRFKEVNDSLGHHAGDSLLRMVADRLRSRARPSDLVVRLGGDEFAVVVPRTAAGPDLGELATRLLEEVRHPALVESSWLDVDASLGIARYPEDGPDASTILRRADVAMYAAKGARTGLERYRPDLETGLSDRLARVSAVIGAAERHELVLHFQPKLDLESMRVTGVEALVRWDHPERGMLSPEHFLPAVDGTEHMRTVTMSVLEDAVEAAGRLRAAGFEVPVAVNLSPRCAADPTLPGVVASMLDRAQLPGSALVVELTESTLLQDTDRAELVLESLRSFGVRVAIDDFGTGYASVAHLRNLPVDELKIDRSYVSKLLDGGQDAVIVRFSIDLARTLGLTVVAEGVEDGAALPVLRDLGCDQIQGHLVSPAVPESELVDLLERLGTPIAVATSS